MSSVNMKMDDYYNQKRAHLLQTAERQRLEEYTSYLQENNQEPRKNWRKWGCYVSERQWGTVRENYNVVDYSWGDGGQPGTFPRDQALHRTYRWGEDGIAGISDDHQNLCFALALWNEVDPCIKERLYGLTNGEGIHGEDVKEYYFYLDNTPTHSYMKYLYKYPYVYPYEELYNKKDSISPYELELDNTGAFLGNRYFDVMIEYAKDDVEDIYIKITAKNCGPEAKTLHLLPTVWFRNVSSFKATDYKNNLYYVDKGHGTIEITQKNIVKNQLSSQMWLYTQGDMTDLLFTENITDYQTVFGSSNNGATYFKNGINQYILGKYKEHKNAEQLASLINPKKFGTKAAIQYKVHLNSGESKTVCLRLSAIESSQPFTQFDAVFEKRIREADEFYDAICPNERRGSDAENELYTIERQAFAGMLWNKQFYYFVADEWLQGDPKLSPPCEAHQQDKKMSNWKHLYCRDILLVPDKYEYPWFAAWDLAFHTVTVSIIDPELAKQQLLLMVLEWYMHPNGQIPAYEWDFGNINPPIHAWAALQVYQQEWQIYGKVDTGFLQRIFDKLNINFTWWVNREDSEGNNLFTGGFLGLDNIRIMERAPGEIPLEQADATAWMAMFCLNMMKMANELKKYDLERKYLQHFIYITDAMNKIGGTGLWDEQAGFFFDKVKDGGSIPVYSVVGLVPLFVIEKMHAHMNEEYNSESFYSLNGTLKWFLKNRPEFIKGNPHINIEDVFNGADRSEASLEGFISVVDKKQLTRILEKVLDRSKFLSEFGIRSLAKDTNYSGYGKSICYEPAESNMVKIMGGNSNWRGPLWFPINYLLIQSLRKFYEYVGDDYKVTDQATGEQKTLDEVCDDLSKRLMSIFIKNTQGKRPVHGNQELFNRPGWDELILFYEYFHGDMGAGLGASHQTGWTGLVANLIQEMGIRKT